MSEVVLCGDIGGTHANFAIARIDKGITLDHITQEVTAEAKEFSSLVNRYLEKIDHLPTRACFAVAGPIRNQKVQMSNTDLVIDVHEIKEKTSLKDVKLINDFEAVGYATNVLEPADQILLNEGHPKGGGVKAAIGAGTGLGKNILIFDQKRNAYLPHPSEGGHGDFPFADEEEIKIAHFIRQRRGIVENVEYEEILSGRGLEALYQYFSGQELSAKEISEKRHSDPLCKKTFQKFVKFYARSAKNFVLDTLSVDGIYIAGGIAAANHDMFDAQFMQEFTRHASPKFRKILLDTPIHLIKNYQISLKGAAFIFSL